MLSGVCGKVEAGVHQIKAEAHRTVLQVGSTARNGEAALPECADKAHPGKMLSRR